MCGLLVHARPRTKFFVFGGAASEISDPPKRFQTRLCSDIGVLTLGEECSWDLVPTVSAAAAAAEQREAAERATTLKRKIQSTIINDSVHSAAAFAEVPSAREGATMAYFAEDSTLVLFGGWCAALNFTYLLFCSTVYS